MAEILNRRALNRALLVRQLLLRRAKLSVPEAVQHLFGLQAQAPNPPYYALWSRLHGFRPDVVARGLTEGTLIRGTAWRGTIHLLTARDYLAVRELVSPLLARVLPGTPFGKEVADLDPGELAAAAIAELTEQPLTSRKLGTRLAQRWPDRSPNALGNAAQHLVPMLQLPPRGVWGQSGQATLSLPRSWLGQDVDPAPDPAEMVRRYLAAYGPASVADMQAFTGARGLREVVDGMRGSLLLFADEHGRDLFDLPDAPRPDPDTPAPPRFTAEFDNLLLGHADRTRVISEDHRRRLFPVNGVIPGAILVDGFVRGSWRVNREQGNAALDIAAFEPLRKKDIDALSSQGMRMLAFCAPEADWHQVRFG